jgi:hypothetical protein
VGEDGTPVVSKTDVLAPIVGSAFGYGLKLDSPKLVGGEYSLCVAQTYNFNACRDKKTDAYICEKHHNPTFVKACRKFRVREFFKPEIGVVIDTDRDSYVAGDVVGVTVTGRNFVSPSDGVMGATVDI